MDEARAREILGECICNDGGLGSGGIGGYLDWEINDDTACLDDHFTADQLEAIAWWMRNKKIVMREPESPKPECMHEKCRPFFDIEKAVKMSPLQIRETYPRFEGYCSECGAKVTLYASFDHYKMGWEK